MQSVFGIFVCIMLVQLLTLIISWVGICCGAKKDFYRLNMVSHTACCKYMSLSYLRKSKKNMHKTICYITENDLKCGQSPPSQLCLKVLTDIILLCWQNVWALHLIQTLGKSALESKREINSILVQFSLHLNAYIWLYDDGKEQQLLFTYLENLVRISSNYKKCINYYCKYLPKTSNNSYLGNNIAKDELRIHWPWIFFTKHFCDLWFKYTLLINVDMFTCIIYAWMYT